MGASKSAAKRKKTLEIVLGILFFLVIGCAVYVSDYYHADETAVLATEDGADYTVETLGGNLVFSPQDAVAGLIFYPGAKVEHVAYAPLMAKLAENGVLCVLVRMPFRLAVLDVNAVDRVIKDFPQIERWYIGGHSLGGAMAASYVANHAEVFDGLILLGAYSSEDLSDSGVKVLSVYGSEDRVLNRKVYEKCRSNLPEGWEEVVINGGCHAYFGYYGAQSGDGEPTISRQEQIQETVSAILRQMEKE